MILQYVPACSFLISAFHSLLSVYIYTQLGFHWKQITKTLQQSSCSLPILPCSFDSLMVHGCHWRTVLTDKPCRWVDDLTFMAPRDESYRLRPSRWKFSLIWLNISTSIEILSKLSWFSDVMPQTLVIRYRAQLMTFPSSSSVLSVIVWL